MGITWTGGWSSDGLAWRQAHGMVPWRTGGLQASSPQSPRVCLEGKAGPGHQRGAGWWAGGADHCAALTAQPQAPSCTGDQTELAAHQGGATTSDIPVFWNRVLSNALL